MGATCSYGEAKLDEGRAWTLLLALKRRAGEGARLQRPCGIRVNAEGLVEECALGLGWVDVRPQADRPFVVSRPLSPAAAQLLRLYLPLCVGARSDRFVVGHIGQSIDGQIATERGASRYVTGPEDLAHTHRLRALTDAVIIGAETAERDDPQLTTRLVPGESPTRVVLDPRRRVPPRRRVFQDGAAPTVVVCARGAGAGTAPVGRAQMVEVRAEGNVLCPADIVLALQRLGLRRLLVEGGGITVSRFLTSRALDWLHVTVAPCLLGRGRPGIVLPAVDGSSHAAGPRVQRFDMGQDVMFDFRFERP
jgi:diaminohydroxyphosphoribosylaminopyrimidine deaminase / 5-amino-6-(5-phosphoribosylamino)uracil reductase